MHWILRPDAAVAFEDPGIKKALPRYIEVVKNRLPAKFLILKSIPIEPEADLWKAHSEGMKEYRRRLKEVDREHIPPEKIEHVDNNLLELKLKISKEMLKSCIFCERRCHVNRYEKTGFCGVGAEARLSSEFLHLGEEACLVPSHTFFFIGCNFYCVYCQNWSISRQFEKGRVVSGKELAEIAEERRKLEKSRNINLVGGDPTPNLHVILEMLVHLNVNVPVVWNSNMYMSSEVMELLEGVVDVYLADFKYGNDKCAERLSKVKNYTSVVKRNHLLAKKQAELIIRHLVLPNHLKCCTYPVLEWIAQNLDNEVRLNIMGQYRPEFEARSYEDISRRVTSEEMSRAFAKAKELNLTNLD